MVTKEEHLHFGIIYGGMCSGFIVVKTVDVHSIKTVHSNIDR